MNYIFDGLKEGVHLLITFDQDVYQVIFLSIAVSFMSSLISSVIGIPLGLLILSKEFRLKKMTVRLINTMMAMPPVVIGLVTAILLARKGPFGAFELMFTPGAMVIAQTILITPIVMGIIINNTKAKAQHTIDTCESLGANRFETFKMLVLELRKVIMGAYVAGFGRAVSEVGAIMLVGGNIRGATRTMTTFIAMNNSMGNYETSIAMGLILILLAFVANTILYQLIE